MLTKQQVEDLRAYLTERRERVERMAETDQKRVDAEGAPLGGALSLHAERLRGKASGLAIALDAIKNIVDEDTGRRWV